MNIKRLIEIEAIAVCGTAEVCLLGSAHQDRCSSRKRCEKTVGISERNNKKT